MYFIRWQATHLNEAFGTSHPNREPIRNPGYINIQYDRIVLPTEEEIQSNPLRYMAIRLNPPTEPCQFRFVYDKDNAQNWHLCLESPSLTPPIYYFPVQQATREAISSANFLATLLPDIHPKTSLLGDKALIVFLLEKIFIANGASHLAHLQEIEQHTQVISYVNADTNQDPALYKNELYIMLDLLATQIDQPATPGYNERMIALLQILHATKDQPERLHWSCSQESCVINSVFQLHKIREQLNIEPIAPQFASVFLNPELRHSIKTYHQQRDHTSSLARYWWTSVTAEQQNREAWALFFHRTWIVLCIANIVGLIACTACILLFGGSLNFLISALIFAVGALYFAYESERPYRPLNLDTNMELSEAEHTFKKYYPTVSGTSIHTLNEVCQIFERQLNVMRRSELPPGYATSHLTLLAARPTARVEPLNHTNAPQL